MKKIRFTALLISFVLLAVTLSVFTTVSAAADSPKLIALTFDDGPSKHTDVLLDVLKQYGAKATFFTVGNRIASRSDTIAREAAEGHQVAGHSYSHAKLTTLSPEEAKKELDSCVAAIKPYTNYQTYLIRPPYGARDDMVKGLGYPLILWSVDTLDWKTRDAESVYQNIMSMTEDGAIILLHDMYETSVQGVARAIPELQAQGYEFVTVSELYRRRGVKIESGTIYRHIPSNGNDLPAVSAPVFTEKEQNGAETLEISVNAADFTIYYTTDGSEPTSGSTVYSGAITVTKPTVFKAVAIDSFGTKSPVGEFAVNANGCEPIDFSVDSDGKLSLSTRTHGANIYYTSDLSEPSDAGTLYTEPFVPDGSIRAVAIKSGLFNSEILTLYRTSYGDLFTDISPDSPYFDAVSEIYHKGLMQDAGSHLFAPEATVTKAEFVTYLAEMSKDDLTKYAKGEVKFSDVPADSRYFASVAWAADSAIAGGNSDGSFGADRPLTREQMCLLLTKYMAYKNLAAGSTATAAEPFSDSDAISAWAAEAVASCHSLGLVQGTGTNAFNPAGTVTRGACAVFLANFDGKLTSGDIALVTTTTAPSTSADSDANNSPGVMVTVLKIVAAVVLSLLFIFVALIAFFRIRAAKRKKRRLSQRARMKYGSSKKQTKDAKQRKS